MVLSVEPVPRGEDPKNGEIQNYLSKQQIIILIQKHFKNLIDNGYIFSVEDLNEYALVNKLWQEQKLVGQDLPREYWDKVFNIIIRHKDTPKIYDFPLEFSITDCPIRREFQIGIISLDPKRRGKGEGVTMIQDMAHMAKEIDFDRILLSGGPYLDKQTNPIPGKHQPNILDWYSSRFPILGNLRERVEANPKEAYLPISAILGHS